MLWSDIINGKAGVRGAIGDTGATTYVDADLLLMGRTVVNDIMAQRPHLAIDDNGQIVDFLATTPAIGDTVTLPDKCALAVRYGIIKEVKLAGYADSASGREAMIAAANAYNSEVAKL